MTGDFGLDDVRLDWARDPGVRPYLFRRPSLSPPRELAGPGGWFPAEPLVLNPFAAASPPFAEMILNLDAAAYAPSGMTMPRWVFYDCGLLPGVVAGYAIHRARASEALLQLLRPRADAEWLPISLFIMIPGQISTEWVAHNLCTINSVLPEAERHYGLGFLSKAFALWATGTRYLVGVTQWTSPALRLHAHFGAFEILSAYTSIHSHPGTLTYRVAVDPLVWPRFFRPGGESSAKRGEAGFSVTPKSTESLKSFQRRLEENDARYYLNADEMSSRAPDDALTVYKCDFNEGY